MDKILTALGLATGTKDADVLAAIEALKGGASALASITEKAKAASIDATPEAIGAALASVKAGGTPDPAKYVPLSMYSELAAKVAKIENDDQERAALSVVAAAVSAGKVTPAQKEWATAYAKSDLKGFETYLASAPVLTRPQALGPTPPASSSALSSGDIMAKAKKYQDDQKASGVDVSWGNAVMAVSQGAA